MFHHTVRTRPFVDHVRFLAVLAAIVTTSLAARAQNAQFNALYQGAEPKADFAFKWKEKGNFTKPVGRLRWEVPPSEFSTGGMDRSFAGYCSEPLVPIIAGNLYRYEVQSPEKPEIYGLPTTEDGVRNAQRRATYVRELFGRYYLGTVKTDDATAPLAFQAALWEIIYESEFPAVPAPFSLFTGNFQANYPNLEQSPAFVQQGQRYLESLTGDDLATFYENTALAGRELVHMKGLANESNVVAQSQFGLRDLGAGGGVPGFNGGTANPGVPAGGFGSGGTGGVGGVAGPGLFSGGSGGGGGGSTDGSTNDTPPSSQNPNDPGPNPDSPPTEGGGDPNDEPDDPGNPDQHSNNPIPAPPAIALGLIAIGIFAGRRAITRAVHKN